MKVRTFISYYTLNNCLSCAYKRKWNARVSCRGLVERCR